MKRFLFIILCNFVILAQSLSYINGASYTVTQKYDSSWELCGYMWGSGTLLYINNDVAFCLDSTKASYVGTNSTVSASSLNLSDKQIETLGLIAWYGYRSKSNPSNTDYFLTQNLIWEYLGTPNNYAKNATYPTKASMRSKLNAIIEEVNNHFKTPSFHNKTYNMNLGDTLTLTDTNNVLNTLEYYSVTGAKITKSQNTLKIVPDGSSNKITIQFHRGLSSKQTGTNFIVRNGSSQPISKCLSGKDTYSSKVTINVNTTGNLQLAKKDPNGKLIGNTTFKLSYNKDMSNPIGTFTTLDDGKIIVEDVKATKVYIQETSVPSYLKLDSTIYEKQIHAGILNYYTAINDWNMTNLQLAKKDPNGKLIANTTFRLSYNEDMSNPIGDFTTLDTGTIIVEDILVRDIYIQEISVPSYLKLDKTIYKKQLYNDIELHYYTLTNEWNKTNLQLAKKDPNGKLIANTTFRLSYNEDMSNPIGDFTTLDDGKIIVEDILVRDIYIQEISVPSYLKLDKTIYKKQLYNDIELHYYTLTNEWNKTNLQLAKKDPNGKLIANTTFRLSYNEDMSNPIGDFTTLDDGKIIVEDLLVKDIYIQEISVPSQLKLDDIIYKKELYNDVALHYYTKVNEWNDGSLLIIKKDNYNNPISNVSFLISYDNEMNDIIGTYTTNSEGQIEINNLKAGEVYIKETDVPNDYVLDSSIHTLYIEPNKQTTKEIINQIKTVDLFITNRVEGNGSDCDKKFLFYITFDKSLNGQFGNLSLTDGSGSFELSHNENIHISSLPINTFYTIREAEYDDYICEVKSYNNTNWNISRSYQELLNTNHMIEFKNTKEISTPTGLTSPTIHYCIIIGISIIMLLLKGGDILG